MSQAVFLRTFPAIYGELLKIFAVREVAGFVRETLGSLPAAAQADCPLEAVKLQCIAKTVEGQLYINPGEEAGGATCCVQGKKKYYNFHNTVCCNSLPGSVCCDLKYLQVVEDEFRLVLLLTTNY